MDLRTAIIAAVFGFSHGLPSNTATLVVVGDSISTYADTRGDTVFCANGSLHNTTCWPDRVATYLGVSSQNFAGGGKCLMSTPSGPVGGHCTGGGNIQDQFAANLIQPYCTGNNTLVMMAGANDINAITEGNTYVTPGGFKTEYETLLNQCISAGLSPSRIFISELTPIPGPGTWTAVAYAQIVGIFNAKIREVATDVGVNLVPVNADFYNQCVPLTNCYWDAIHPNNVGDAIIAQAFEKW